MTNEASAQEEYRVVGVTQKDVAEGVLSRISKVIEQIVTDSSRAVADQKTINPERKWARILFDNPLAHSSEYGSPDYYDVLYINEHAYNLLNVAGIPLKVLDVTTELPESAGIFLNIPTWV